MITNCSKKYNSKGTVVVVQRDRERGTVTGTHTHTEEWRDMERDTHRVMHTKIKRGEGREMRERMTNDIMCHINSQ